MHRLNHQQFFFLGVNFFGTPSRLILIRYTETNLKLCFQLLNSAATLFQTPKKHFQRNRPINDCYRSLWRFYNIEWEWASFSESLIQFGSLGSCHKTLVVSSEIFQKNPLCANKRRRAGVISRSRVYYCNEFAFYIFPVYSSVVTRYLRSTCCKSTFQAPTLSWYRQVKNFRIGCSSKSKINFCDLAT